MNPITWLKNKFKKQQVKIEPITEPVPSEPVITPSTSLIDREKFFISVDKNLVGVLNEGQISGFNSILSSWETFEPAGDLRHLAYMLATTWHETARTMWPITEYGSQKYLRSKKYWPYIGRGFVQLTWKHNYEKYGIADEPELALDLTFASHVLIHGMVNGIFTGKKLSDYFSDKKSDPIGARRIINGKDKAELIAGYYYKFLDALNYKKEV